MFTERQRRILRCAVETIHMADHAGNDGQKNIKVELALALLTAEWQSLDPKCEELHVLTDLLEPNGVAESTTLPTRPVSPHLN